jgi:serine/threonine protein kinase
MRGLSQSLRALLLRSAFKAFGWSANTWHLPHQCQWASPSCRAARLQTPCSKVDNSRVMVYNIPKGPLLGQEVGAAHGGTSSPSNKPERHPVVAVSLLGTTLGEFLIQEEIGRGGMAIVYKAWQPSLGRHVALKVLPPLLTLDSTFIERFRREAIGAAQLQHPNIVTIYNVGEQDGIHYIAMSYITGRSLDQLLNEEGPLPLDRATAILHQVAAALDFAHGNGLVHRDIKPANILVGRGDHATLTDFGLVKAAAGTSLTRSGIVVGSPPYMAPEQVRGLEVGPAADRYALGIVLYEMLSGRTPFVGDTPTVLHAHVYDSPPPLHQLNRKVPREADGVLRRALAKQPQYRFRSAEEMVVALEGVRQAVKTVRRKRSAAPAAVPTKAPARLAPPPTPASDPTKVMRPAKAAVDGRAAPAPIRRRQRVRWVWLLVALLVVTAGSVLAWRLGGGSDVPSVPGQATEELVTSAPAVPSITPTVTRAAMDGSSSATVTHTTTPSPSATAMPTQTETPKPSATASPTRTATRTARPRATNTVAPTDTPIPTSAPTNTVPPTKPPAPQPTETTAPQPTQPPPLPTQPPPQPTQPPQPTEPPEPPTRTPRPP